MEGYSAVVSNCKSCEAATASPWLSGRYQSGCPGCQARAFAQSPDAKDALLGHPGALVAAMRATWPTQEAYRVGRLAVYDWIKRIDEAKAKT